MQGGDLAGYSLTLELDRALELYRQGLFPLPVEGGFAWFLPELRAVMRLGPGAIPVSTSTMKLAGRYRVAIDLDPLAVVEACAGAPRPGGWIDGSMIAFYREAAEAGHLHSVEVYGGGGLAGGLFGIAAGGVFCGESMFHAAPNTSKLALAVLAGEARRCGYALIDGQWVTSHLISLGFETADREGYRRMLEGARKAATVPFKSGPLEMSRARLQELIAPLRRA